MASQNKVIQLLVQQFPQTNTKENIEALHHWRFVRGIHRWTIDTRHKGPVMREVFHIMIDL